MPLSSHLEDALLEIPHILALLTVSAAVDGGPGVVEAVKGLVGEEPPEGTPDARCGSQTSASLIYLAPALI